ncbi:hypothetical protein [Streptomyces justiciae]|uniref:Uncharacterized protein n=1 Tax=Streptomyces justiciae TaxID=2780140 RepID=A0ABU3M6V4_9ACTN|nr:hypothetical protein [Streptomyces justiciae]MDT7847257.1 hypothetical protein [Streptomyces justiciae]
MAEQQRQIPEINVERIDASLLPGDGGLYVIESGDMITFAFAREHISPRAAQTLSAVLSDMTGRWRQGPWPPQPGS